MTFTINRKTLIIITSSVAGIILLWGILSVFGHRRYDRNDFGRNFGNPGCWANFVWNPTQMMSGIENIIATKDYTAFQKLFSGSRMGANISTPEKFATRVELHTAMKTVQDLQAKLWSPSQDNFGPMLFGNKKILKEWKKTRGCSMR